MALSDEVKARFDATMLVQLTNADPAATTINDTILDAAAADTIGEFQRVARFEFDLTQAHHVSLCVKGVMYHLMMYKNLDSRNRDKFESDFYGGCGALSRLGYTNPATTSTLENKRDRQNALPDMNKRKLIFGRGVVNKVNEFND